MKKIITFLLIGCIILLLAGCVSIEGVPQEEYDALKASYDQIVAERDALLKASGDQTSTSSISVITTEPVTTQATTNKTPVIAGKFNAETVISQLEVTEYLYDSDWWNYAFLVIKNNSEFDIEISADIKFYNEDGELIGAKSNSEHAFESGTEILMYFMPDEDFARMEYEFTIKEEKWYECVVSELSYESTKAKNKEIVSVTNKGSDAAEFVNCYALFFKNGKVVEFSSSYFTDDDYELKSGKTITKELDCYEEYDTVRLFFTGRR